MKTKRGEEVLLCSLYSASRNRGALLFQGGYTMADNKSSEGNIKGISIQLDIDAFGAIKGLKAIQREARKATAALRELEEQKNKIK